MIPIEQLAVNRAVFNWAQGTKRISWGEYRALLRDILQREWRLNGCHKAPFLTFKLASRVAKIRRGHDGHRRRRAYRCHLCGFFHIAEVEYARDQRLMVKERLHA